MERLPIFERPFVKKLLIDRLARIAEAVAERVGSEPEPGLLTGLAGQSLFLYHYGRTMGSDRFENLGFLALQRALAMIEGGFSWPSYATGLAGIRYALRYLAIRGFIGEDEGSALDGLTPMMDTFASERLREGDYDVLHGALGMIMAPSQSLSLTGPPDNKQEAKRARQARALLDELLKQGVCPAEGQLAWESKNPKTSVREINLGLAHGVPSILLMLSRHKPARAVAPIVSFLLANRLHDAPNGSAFPHRLVDGQPDQPGRLAWCYGDPGVAAALWQAGAMAGRPDWQTEASTILRKAAGRTRLKPNRLFDACLCHGTAGIALIFYKMGELTGHAELSDAAARWTQATLDLGNQEGFAGGYSYFTTGNRFVSNYGLLEGITGTGLALLSLLEPENLGWEAALLI